MLENVTWLAIVAVRTAASGPLKSLEVIQCNLHSPPRWQLANIRHRQDMLAMDPQGLHADKAKKPEGGFLSRIMGRSANFL